MGAERARTLEEAIRACGKCEVLGKPFVEHAVYRLWLPREVRLLLVAESPPPGQKEDFFYNLDRPDRLRRNLRAILGLELGDAGLLEWLREHGIFLTGAVKCRPRRPERGYRDERLLKRMALNCSDVLALELELLKPERVLALGRVARTLIEHLRPDVPVDFFPHPNYIVRFKRDVMPALREAISRALRGA